MGTLGNSSSAGLSYIAGRLSGNNIEERSCFIRRATHHRDPSVLTTQKESRIGISNSRSFLLVQTVDNSNNSEKLLKSDDTIRREFLPAILKVFFCRKALLALKIK